MTRAFRRTRATIVCVPLVTLLSCSSFLVPNPRTTHHPSRPPASSSAPRGDDTTRETTDTLDFALAFATEPLPPDGRASGSGAHEISPTTGLPLISVPTSSVRVMLAQNVPSVSIVFPSSWYVATRAGHKRGGGAGTGGIKPDRAGVALRVGRRVTHAVTLPCTLSSDDGTATWGVDSASYRGALVVIPARSGRISIVNLIDMEEYLRGVVPLELGARDRTLIEAVKAQAVAARTYAYRRVLGRRNAVYDLLPTVADQVYGGARVEDRVADEAVRETRGQVLSYAGEPIVAYYHSTCGGTTASVEDVWDKAAIPYLRSVSDIDTSGQPYCSDSRYANWTYTWDTKLLSSLIGRYGVRVSCGRGRFGGWIEKMVVVSRGICGRVGRLIVQGTQGNAEFRGDKTRRALRRNEKGHPMLPSAWFDIEVKGRTVTARGKGYGHGVGMCQMGALGRARAGQSYLTILSTYYTGAVLSEAGEDRDDGVLRR